MDPRRVGDDPGRSDLHDPPGRLLAVGGGRRAQPVGAAPGGCITHRSWRPPRVSLCSSGSPWHALDRPPRPGRRVRDAQVDARYQFTMETRVSTQNRKPVRPRRHRGTQGARYADTAVWASVGPPRHVQTAGPCATVPARLAGGWIVDVRLTGPDPQQLVGSHRLRGS
jgi:hypothetical protein